MQAIAQNLVDEDGSHSTVHSAGQRTDSMRLWTNLQQVIAYSAYRLWTCLIKPEQDLRLFDNAHEVLMRSPKAGNCPRVYTAPSIFQVLKASESSRPCRCCDVEHLTAMP